MQYKISKITRYQKKKDGSSYTDRDGVAQQRITMQLEGVDGFVSFFDGIPGLWGHLANGSTVEGEVVQSGDFKNFEFSSPPAEQPSNAAPAPAAPQTAPANGKVEELLTSILRVLEEIRDKDLPF